jgi:hypothetical protein
MLAAEYWNARSRNGTALARKPENGGFCIEAGGWHNDGLVP